ncbi:MAG: sulfite exporter TauE/SafE family protein [Anaerolineae bacterium]|nr:sulfite exporter TauE/SafE family protein [Anaerolineae bacterium]
MVILVMALGALLHGSAGLGIGLIGAPLLVLIEPRLVPGAILSSSLALTLLMLLRERRHVDFFGLKWAVAGRIVGTLAATYLLVNLPVSETSVVIGVLVLLAVGLSVGGLRIKRNTGILIGAGVLSGVMGTLASVGGPPVALLYQDEKGPRIRATMSGFFIFGTLLSLASLILVGRYDWQDLLTALFIVPGVVVGFSLSGRVARWIDKGYTRAAILFVCGVSALVVILRQVL